MKVQVLQIDYHFLDRLLYTAARTCYSKESPIKIFYDTIGKSFEDMEKTIFKALDAGHLSIAEHYQFNILIEGVSRALTHQLVRHRHCTYCIDEDTLISYGENGKKKIKIKDLFTRPDQYKQMMNIRCLNEDTKELVSGKLKEVFYTGEQEVFEILTDSGYKINATKNHKFLTKNGWKILADLKINDFVMVNGMECYKDKNWLENKYRKENLTIPEIAAYCGYSKSTISKWVRKYHLQKELGKGMLGRTPPNKGKNKYNYEPMMRTSIKMKGNKNFIRLYGSDSPAWKGDNVKSGYTMMHRYYAHSNICSNCGPVNQTHFHHRDKNPFNNSEENVIELCIPCHKSYHHKLLSVIVPSKIISIKKVGIRKTYDLALIGPNHNFIANGFVVHNSMQSQRYCKFEGGFDYIIPPSINCKPELKEGFKLAMHSLSELYDVLVQEGIKAEDARYLFPNACTTNLVLSCNLRELMHICNERLCTCAQMEIRQLILDIARQVINWVPWTQKYLVAKCENLGYCNEIPGRSCGKKPLKNKENSK